MIYFIRCKYYQTGRWLLDQDLKDHKGDLSIRRVDLGRLMVVLMNGDQIHYVPDCVADRWFIGRRSKNLIEIRSLGELVKNEENSER